MRVEPFACARSLRVMVVAVACGAGLEGGERVAVADVLPIINPGFEQLNVTLRPGEQTNGAGGVPAGSGLPETAVNTRWQFPFQANGNVAQTGVIVPGWRTMPGGTGSLAGVLNPNVQFGSNPPTPWMTGYSGNHVGVAQAAFMQQTLSVQLAPATTYTLSFLAGIGITDSEYSPLIQLLGSPDLATFARPGTAGVETLAQLPLTQIRQAQFGQMLPLSFSYTTPAVLPGNLQGKYIAIAFLGSDGIPRMNYDDFRLEATPVPAPGIGGMGMAVAGVLVWGGRRRVSRGGGR